MPGFEEFSNRGKLSDKNFSELAAFITTHLGIKMPPAKRDMLQSRILKRMRKRDIGSYDQYFEFLFKQGGIEQELDELVNVVTTNKTDFFREPKHFLFLTETALPELIATTRKSRLEFWCAGCATGEEPHTLAIVLQEFAEQHPHFDYQILATDVSSQALRAARLGVYRESQIEVMDMPLRKKYLLRARDREKKQVRIVPALRRKIRFAHLNFMDQSYHVAPKELNVVFFRNVMIYFSPETQEKVLNRIGERMSRGAYLFTGHSESLRDLDIPFQMIRPAVYKKT